MSLSLLLSRYVPLSCALPLCVSRSRFLYLISCMLYGSAYVCVLYLRVVGYVSANVSVLLCVSCFLGCLSIAFDIFCCLICVCVYVVVRLWCRS